MKPTRLFLLLFLFLHAVPALAARTASFSFTDLDGITYTPENLRGRPLLIYVGSHL
ncbi:MAG: hypothetical protein ACOY4H_08250 [Thermodesulfobacteriota bacterium]